MDKLWSTWRSQYIQSFNEEKKEPSGCIFCSAAGEELTDEKSLVVRKNRLTFTVLNLYPYNNGHLMVVPYRHTHDFMSLTPEESAEIVSELKMATAALSMISKPEGFNIGANLGKCAGAGIADHIHFHVVPRWNGDTNFMPVLGEVKVLSQDLLATKAALIEAYSKLQ
ncbi:MAG: HIT domain-containing protein [Ignavibacteriaceae bacterium]|nr:HIT domain-containing protein [Ignavibacteriaceae bacterium]